MTLTRIIVLVLTLFLVFFLQEAAAWTSYPPGLSSYSQNYHGNYPEYMSLRYRTYAGGEYQHYYYNSGSNMETLNRMQVQSLRNKYPYGQARRYVKPSYTRNYYTTDMPKKDGLMRGFSPPYRQFYGHYYY
ncbi:MAG: hypothetical protein ABIJ21_04060 [Nanoarchaeota archaeon]